MKIQLGVVFGGCSVEHEISIISAMQAIENIDKEKYDVIPIYISKDRDFYIGEALSDMDNYKDLSLLIKNLTKVTLVKKNNEFCLINVDGFIKSTKAKIDFVLPIVHGQNVEDGTLAGYFETIGIPYAFSGVLGSCLGQDKVILKQILENNDVPVVPYVWFYDEEYINNKDNYLNQIKKLKYPVIVKPARLGSSIGIKYVASSDEIEDAIDEAISYDSKIIVEKAIIDLNEINCSVMGNYKNIEVGNLEEVYSKSDFLTFDDKYVGGGKGKKGSKGIVNTKREFNVSIDKKMVKDIKECSKNVFRLLELSGVCRIDYLIDTKNNKFYVNEPNTIPGSLAFYLWDMKYSELLDKIIKTGIDNYKSKNKKTRSFESNVLAGFKGAKGVKKQ